MQKVSLIFDGAGAYSPMIYGSVIAGVILFSFLIYVTVKHILQSKVKSGSKRFRDTARYALTLKEHITEPDNDYFVREEKDKTRTNEEIVSVLMKEKHAEYFHVANVYQKNLQAYHDYMNRLDVIFKRPTVFHSRILVKTEDKMLKKAIQYNPTAEISLTVISSEGTKVYRNEELLKLIQGVR